MTEKTWLLVRTRADYELKFSEHLRHKNFETYCPRTISKSKERRKPAESAVFTSLLFVKLGEAQFDVIKKIDGFKGFVYWMNLPLVLKDFEFDLMYRFLSDNPSVRVEKCKVDPFGLSRLITNYEPGVQQDETTQKIAIPSLGYILHSKSTFKPTHKFDYSELGTSLKTVSQGAV